jgi:AcrR family transcriptional regulator
LRIHTVAYDHRVPRQRLSREDWERAALDAIAEGGLAAVAVEPLAARLGVTKGSFYAHFPTRDALIEAALARWERTHADPTEFAGVEDPAARLERAMRTAVEFSQSGAPSVHVKLLGELHDARARAAVARVTAGRLARLTATYRQLGFPAKRAEDRARLAYAAYVGLLQAAREAPERRLDKREIVRLMRELRATLLAPP